MARAPLIKQILKPILAQNADVVLIERSLVMLPIRHVLRAVTFNYGRYSQRWLDVETYSSTSSTARDFISPLWVVCWAYHRLTQKAGSECNRMRWISSVKLFITTYSPFYAPTMTSIVKPMH